MHIAQHLSPPLFLGIAAFLSYIRYCKFVTPLFDFIRIPITNNLVFIVITTMLVIILTLITITVLPKLTLFWV